MDGGGAGDSDELILGAIEEALATLLGVDWRLGAADQTELGAFAEHIEGRRAHNLFAPKWLCKHNGYPNGLC